MKIEIRKLEVGLITEGADFVKCKLFLYLYHQAYDQTPYGKWQPVTASSTAKVMKKPIIDLNHMALTLRAQGWSAYYWRDRDGLHNVDDWNTYINYGRREGLILGRYCANLTAWLLANT